MCTKKKLRTNLIISVYYYQIIIFNVIVENIFKKIELFFIGINVLLYTNRLHYLIINFFDDNNNLQMILWFAFFFFIDFIYIVYGIFFNVFSLIKL